MSNLFLLQVNGPKAQAPQGPVPVSTLPPFSLISWQGLEYHYSVKGIATYDQSWRLEAGTAACPAATLASQVTQGRHWTPGPVRLGTLLQESQSLLMASSLSIPA